MQNLGIKNAGDQIRTRSICEGSTVLQIASVQPLITDPFAPNMGQFEK